MINNITLELHDCHIVATTSQSRRLCAFKMFSLAFYKHRVSFTVAMTVHAYKVPIALFNCPLYGFMHFCLEHIS